MLFSNANITVIQLINIFYHLFIILLLSFVPLCNSSGSAISLIDFLAIYARSIS